MLSKNLLISVIIPFYKEFEVVNRAVSSVAVQRIPPFVSVEILIGNDSSFPDQKVFEAISPKFGSLVTVVSNNNAKGAGNARNAALDAAKGDVIAFLDADDFWEQGKLDIQLQLIEKGSNFVAGAYSIGNSNVIIKPPEKISSPLDLLFNTNVGTSTVLLTTSLLGGDRFCNLQFSQDTELWARLAGKSSFRYDSTNIVCAIYSPSLRTANKFEQFMKFRNVVKRFNLRFIDELLIYSRYVIRGIVNHYVRKQMWRGTKPTRKGDGVIS